MKTTLAVLLAAGCALAGCAVAPTQAGPQAGEPLVQRLVSEDEHVRVEELRVRGQTQRLSVQPKGTEAKAYEILPARSGSNPSEHRDGAGQRVWPVLSF
jgi:starvation-inducible outer membrane lipoprotein